MSSFEQRFVEANIAQHGLTRSQVLDKYTMRGVHGDRLGRGADAGHYASHLLELRRPWERYGGGQVRRHELDAAFEAADDARLARMRGW